MSVRHDRVPRSHRQTLEHYAAVLVEARLTMPLYYLRGNDPDVVRSIARGGGPLFAGDDFHVYCPVCRCGKSGDVEIPNYRTDACANDACLCHSEEDVEYQVCIEHEDRPAVVEVNVSFPNGLTRWVPVCGACRNEWVEPKHERTLSW